MDSGPIGTDGGDVTPANCPADAPMREDMRGACCYRVSNADRLDAPEMRLSGLKLLTPTSISGGVVGGLLKSALDQERFNWIFATEITGTDATVRTGYGERNADGTFSFVSDPPAWAPVTLTGTIAGETITTGPFDGAMTVPVFDEDGVTLTAEFPLRNLELNMATMSESRSCIGNRRSADYDTRMALLTSYVTVEESKTVEINVGTTLNTTLCMFLANRSTEAGNCDTPQAEWPTPPDSTCDTTAGTCSRGGCDASTCNAWQLTGEFAAHGVEITN